MGRSRTGDGALSDLVSVVVRTDRLVRNEPPDRWLYTAACAAPRLALGVFGYGLNIAGTNLNLRTLVIVEYGTFIYWASIGGFAIKVCVTMACLAMIVAFDESKDEETELAT